MSIQKGLFYVTFQDFETSRLHHTQSEVTIQDAGCRIHNACAGREHIGHKPVRISHRGPVESSFANSIWGIPQGRALNPPLPHRPFQKG